MEHIFDNLINNGTVFQKGLFLMIAGIGFVFTVQVIFYSIVKFWPRGKKPS